jgi:hypothetical protein
MGQLLAAAGGPREPGGVSNRLPGVGTERVTDDLPHSLQRADGCISGSRAEFTRGREECAAESRWQGETVQTSVESVESAAVQP